SLTNRPCDSCGVRGRYREPHARSRVGFRGVPLLGANDGTAPIERLSMGDRRMISPSRVLPFDRGHQDEDRAIGAGRLCIWPLLAVAEEQLSGEDAAYIDWARQKLWRKKHRQRARHGGSGQRQRRNRFPAQVSEQELARCPIFARRACDDVRRYQGLVWSLWQQVCPSHQMAEWRGLLDVRQPVKHRFSQRAEADEHHDQETSLTAAFGREPRALIAIDGKSKAKQFQQLGGTERKRVTRLQNPAPAARSR